MFCRYCGKEIPEDSSFCSFCQKNLSQVKSETEIKTEPTVKPYVRAEHIRKERPVVPKSESTTMGIVSWVLASYSILTIFMIIIGVFGYVTSTDAGGATYTFQNSARTMLYTVSFLVGKLPAPAGAPVWITAVIPFTFIVMSMSYAIIQFIRNKKTFSKVTLITVSSLTVVMILLNIFLYDAIITGILS